MEQKYIRMEDVIGVLAHEYGWPVISFDDLITLGKCTVNVYGLKENCKKISFEILCVYITKFIQTPFGRNMLKQLSQ